MAHGGIITMKERNSKTPAPTEGRLVTEGIHSFFALLEETELLLQNLAVPVADLLNARRDEAHVKDGHHMTCAKAMSLARGLREIVDQVRLLRGHESKVLLSEANVNENGRVQLGQSQFASWSEAVFKRAVRVAQHNKCRALLKADMEEPSQQPHQGSCRPSLADLAVACATELTMLLLVDQPAWELVKAQLQLDEDRIIVSRSRIPTKAARPARRKQEPDPESNVGKALKSLRDAGGSFVNVAESYLISRLRNRGFGICSAKEAVAKGEEISACKGYRLDYDPAAAKAN
jgi:hypothetical protein